MIAKRFADMTEAKGAKVRIIQGNPHYMGLCKRTNATELKKKKKGLQKIKRKLFLLNKESEMV